MTLTWRERDALQYLDGLMEATSAMIGERIATGGENPARVGGAVAGRLYRRNPRLVTYLFDLHAWRITAAGRAARAESDETARKGTG